MSEKLKETVNRLLGPDRTTSTVGMFLIGGGLIGLLIGKLDYVQAMGVIGAGIGFLKAADSKKE